MADARDEDARVVEWWRARDRAIAAECVERWRRERIEALRRLVDEFGAEAVERIERQRDPAFELPRELKDTKEE